MTVLYNILEEELSTVLYLGKRIFSLMNKFIDKYKIPILASFALILALLGAIFMFIGQSGQSAKNGNSVQYKTSEEKNDISVRFAMEAYDTVIDKYWMATSTYDLPKIF